MPLFSTHSALEVKPCTLRIPFLFPPKVATVLQLVRNHPSRVCRLWPFAVRSAGYAEFLTSATLITGGCYCGAIRYEVAALPLEVTHCHCIDCRRSSGATMVTWASFARDRFRVIHGQP
jgi:Glutathione-dependent formaldehyde-activating enzyme